MPDLPVLLDPIVWARSSRCEAGHCIVARRDGRVVHLRDSAAGDDATVLTVPVGDFAAFLAGAKLGDFAAFLAGAKLGDFDHLLGSAR